MTHRDRPRWHWWVLLAGSAGAMVFGVWGFLDYDQLALAEAQPLFRGQHLARAFYETLQLFALHAPHFERSMNIPLYVACYLATIVSLWTVLGIFQRVYSTELHHFRLSYYRNHVVICGAGWRGLALARDYSSREGERRGDKVVVIERDPHAPGLQVCDELGVPYVLADASDPRALRAAGAGRARLLIATCTDDGLNLKIALNARQIVESFRPQDGPLKCYIQLSNRYLRTMARQKHLIADSRGRIEISTVGLDVYENGARRLFNRYPLDWRPIRHDSPLQALLLIFGLGDMGESVLLQAARIGHFANRRRLRIIVVDREATKRQAELKSRYPRLGDICDVEFHNLDVNDPTLIAWAEHMSGEAQSLATLVLSLPGDALNLALALNLGQSDGVRANGCQIRVRMSSNSGLAALLSETRQRELFGDQIRPFGMLEEACNKEALEETQLDALARGIHADYVAQQAKSGQAAPYGVAWEDLSEEAKGSNRDAADHIEIKLRAVGLRSVNQGDAAEPVTEFSPEQIEVLARMEHERYCAQRMLAGWTPGPKRDVVKKTNPTLVPWADLSEAERKKDSDQVQLIPRILAAVGRSIRAG
ncbi:MAG: NAD-binding protein [Opitutaceae bacterium]